MSIKYHRRGDHYSKAEALAKERMSICKIKEIFFHESRFQIAYPFQSLILKPKKNEENIFGHLPTQCQL